MAKEDFEAINKQLARLNRRVSEMECDSLVYRQLFITFLTNSMPQNMTDEAFTAKLDKFFRFLEKEHLDEESPRLHAMKASINSTRRDIMNAWAAQRWSAAKRFRAEDERAKKAIEEIYR
ncbi:hypothetical protein [Gluconobacter cerinus]|uniref:hypothetical protein n=1 Tax=Gluconobacter cerinus TaxID=38307 RepID=UPI001B8D4123|nr:hypothetical protein [Gluconobacter cerinus]MBS1035373.1 hypothetical protein [Gluconobacter cerinus]